MTTRTILLAVLVTLTLCLVASLASARQLPPKNLHPHCIACGSSGCQRQCMSYCLARSRFVPQGALVRWLDGVYPRPEVVRVR